MEGINKSDPVGSVINKIEEDRNIEKKTLEYFIKENKYNIFKLKSIEEYYNQPDTGSKLEILSDLRDLRDLEIKLQEVGKSYGLSEEEIQNYIKRSTSN